MRTTALARDMVPVQEFRKDLASWIERVEQSGGPVIVTQRGRAAAALVSPDALDELEERRELIARVLAGLDDLEHGRLHEDEDVWADVEAVIQAAENDGAGSVDR